MKDLNEDVAEKIYCLENILTKRIGEFLPS